MSLPPRLDAIARSPIAFLMALTFINWLGFAGWGALFNNFAKEAAAFDGFQVGLAQTVREIPGFLAFTAIAWFLIMREQTLAYVALMILGFGIAITGYLPTLTGVLLATFVMSVGFHYFETVNQSLSLQLFRKAETPRALGRIAGAGAAAQFVALGGVALAWHFNFADFALVFAVIGGGCVILTIAACLFFKRFEGTVPQKKEIVLRRRYWLYYALTFMSGARRQIFMAFAGFMLVERFGFKVPEIALLMLSIAALNTFLAPRLGALVAMIGERRSIQLENIILVLVFLGYAFVDDGRVAAALFVVDGVIFTLVIAQRTYFQKIGDAADMAPTAAVSFTINHIAAVVIPITFGLIWLKSPALVFGLGAVIATLSLALAFLVPKDPAPGQETSLRRAERLAPAE